MLLKTNTLHENNIPKFCREGYQTIHGPWFTWDLRNHTDSNINTYSILETLIMYQLPLLEATGELEAKPAIDQMYYECQQ